MAFKEIIPIHGDVTGDTGTSTVVKIQGNAVEPGTLGSAQDGYVLTWINGSSEFQVLPGSGGGSTPTGPAGGDLSGTYPNPFVKSLSGNAGGGGAITLSSTSTFIQAAGVSQKFLANSDGAAVLTLDASDNPVIEMPVGQQVIFTDNNTPTFITLDASLRSITLDPGLADFTIGWEAATSGVFGGNLNIQSQTSTDTFGTPGNINLIIPSPITDGYDAFVTVVAQSNTVVQLGAVPHSGGNKGAIWLIPGGSADPTSFGLLMDNAGATQVNCAAGHTIGFSGGGTTFVCHVDPQDFAIAGDINLASGAGGPGALTIGFPENDDYATTFNLGADLLLASQRSTDGAGQPGNVIAFIPQTNGTESFFQVQSQATVLCQIGGAPGGSGGNTNIYLTPAVIPSTTNYTLSADSGGGVILNSTGGGVVSLSNGNTPTLVAQTTEIDLYQPLNGGNSGQAPKWFPVSQALSNANVDLSATNQHLMIFTGTITANIVVTVPGTINVDYLVDVTALSSTGTHTLTFKAGTGAKEFSITISEGTQGLYELYVDATGNSTYGGLIAS